MGIAVPSAGKNGTNENWGWIEHFKKEQNVKGVRLGRNIKIKQNQTYKKEQNLLDLYHRDLFLCYYSRSEC